MAKKPKLVGYGERTQEPHITCCGCGVTLTYMKKYEGLPCNSYCCGKCCPHKNESPCPKERKFKESVVDGLFALQHGE